MRRALAGVVAVLCGFEIVAAIWLGGAGLTAILGWEVGLVLVSVAIVGIETMRRRRSLPNERIEFAPKIGGPAD